MTPAEIRLVQRSFDDAFPVYVQLTERFYTRLFERAPEVRRLFRHDLTQQKEKFANMLASAVAMLDQGEKFQAVVRDMGLRHASYGVLVEHFEPVGEALLQSLSEVQGPSFTPEVRAAWLALFSDVRATMIEAMRQAA